MQQLRECHFGGEFTDLCKFLETFHHLMCVLPNRNYDLMHLLSVDYIFHYESNTGTVIGIGIRPFTIRTTSLY